MAISQFLKSLAFASVHVAIAGGALAGVVGLQLTQLKQPDLWKSDPTQAQAVEANRLAVLRRSPSFGFDNLIADWTFLGFLQYDGDDEARERLGYELAPAFFDVITLRDPRFADIYLYLAGTLSHQMGRPDLSAQYIKRGTDVLCAEMHPLAFLPWRLLGLDQIILTGDIQGAIVSHEQAATLATGSSLQRVRETAPIFKTTADYLRRNPGSAAVRLMSWNTVYAQAQARGDQQTVTQAKQAMINLGAIEQRNDRGDIYFTLPEKPTPAPSPTPTPTPTPQTLAPQSR